MWDEEGETREGVFIQRRDTNSSLNYLAGGRIFPGEHHQAEFAVAESASEIKLEMESKDGQVKVNISGEVDSRLPSSSIFSSLDDASHFFKTGSVGFSVTSDPSRLDGLKLQTNAWKVEPLRVADVYSSYFSDELKFPKDKIAFDHALLMRNVEHEWHSVDDLYI